MFLRSQLGSRLAPAVLRLCGNSAPSASYFSQASSVLSRCNNHVIATSNPQLARHFGTSVTSTPVVAGKRSEEVKVVKGTETKQANGSSSYKNAKVDENELGRAFALVITGCSSFILWLVAFDRLNDKAIPADAEHVDFKTFTKYLEREQIEKIFLVGARDKAVGILREGAIIDGKPAKSGHIVFDYPHSLSQLFCDVRKEEAEMAQLGHPPSQKVEIKTFFNPTRVFVQDPLTALFVFGGLMGLAAELVAKKPKKRVKMLVAVLVGFMFAALEYKGAMMRIDEKALADPPQTKMEPKLVQQSMVIWVN